MEQPVGQSAVSRLFGKWSGPFGFGTGLLHHAGNQHSRVRLLRQAHDQGVSYFDTARLYADGQAEEAVGEAFSRIRNDIIIATKVGILPVRRDLVTRARGKAAASLRRIAPLKALVPEPPVQHPEFGVFDSKRMQISLETSLRRLRTDHVDAVLLHECTLDNLRSDEVREFLDRAVLAGKARMYGIAPTAPEMLAIAASGAAYGDIAQFDAAIRNSCPTAGTVNPSLVITHSCLGQRFRSVVNRMRTDADLRERWSRAAGIDAGDTSQVAQAFLAHALIQNPNGLVLFSTTRPDRLSANLAAEGWLSEPERRGALGQLIAEVSAAQTADTLF